MKDGWPPCGIYKTSVPLGGVQEGRLVLFHNHGDPGPGIYPPESWKVNRATFSQRGNTIDRAAAETLLPLLAEGLYRVEEAFFCCDKECRSFPADLLVQLGYNGRAEPILFLPQWTDTGLALPQSGQRVDAERLARLGQLILQEEKPTPSDRYH